MSSTNISALQVLDLFNNRLTGEVSANGSFSLFTPISFANNDLCGPVTLKPCPGSPPFSPPLPYVLPPPVSTQGGNSISSTGAIAEEDPEVHLGQLKRFSLRELQVITDRFNNKNILGRGGFGKVYKGRLVDGSLVAVKRQFQTEVEMISMAMHSNLLRLRSFCMTPIEPLLVYPYMANGSVASCFKRYLSSSSYLPCFLCAFNDILSNCLGYY